MSRRLPEADDDDTGGPAQVGTLRVDKWLWFARVVKTRALAQVLIEQGKVRLNRDRLDKPSRVVRRDDVLTVSVHQRVRVLKVLDIGERRGPAVEAQGLYEDLTPPAVVSTVAERLTEASGVRAPGLGRPTKRDRRLFDKLKGDQNE